MFSKLYFSCFDTTQIAMHCQMERWIVIFSCAEKLINGYIYPKFLLYFAHKGKFSGFSFFNLTARKLPHTLKFAISSLSSKIGPVFIYNCSNNLYDFHNISVLPSRCASVAISIARSRVLITFKVIL